MDPEDSDGPKPRSPFWRHFWTAVLAAVGVDEIVTRHATILPSRYLQGAPNFPTTYEYLHVEGTEAVIVGACTVLLAVLLVVYPLIPRIFRDGGPEDLDGD